MGWWFEQQEKGKREKGKGGAMTQLLLGLLFSLIGMGYCMYGRRQRAIAPMVFGVALMVFPYFVGSVWLMVLVGTGLAAAPYWVRW